MTSDYVWTWTLKFGPFRVLSLRREPLATGQGVEPGIQELAVLRRRTHGRRAPTGIMPRHTTSGANVLVQRLTIFAGALPRATMMAAMDNPGLIGCSRIDNAMKFAAKLMVKANCHVEAVQRTAV